MKKTVTTDAKIEEVELFGTSVVFTCLTPKRRQFSTTVTFDDGAHPHAASFKKWLLLCQMAAAYGIDLNDLQSDRKVMLLQFTGRFFRFRLVEWKRHWLIDKFRRCDPFEFPEVYDITPADIERWIKERDEVS